jgi:hypothetical protein
MTLNENEERRKKKESLTFIILLSGTWEDKKLGKGFLGLKKWGGLGTRGFLKTCTRDQPRPTRIVQILTKIYDFNTKIQTLRGGRRRVL